MRGLKGSGKILGCVEFCADFEKQMQKGAIKFEAGADVARKQIISDIDFGIVQDGVDEAITRNGRHQFMLVTGEGGKQTVFDNLNPEGISLKDWADKTTILKDKKEVTGEELIKHIQNIEGH